MCKLRALCNKVTSCYSNCYGATSRERYHDYSTQVMTTNIKRLWTILHAKLLQPPFKTSSLKNFQGGKRASKSHPHQTGSRTSPATKSFASGGVLLFDVDSCATSSKGTPGVIPAEKSLRCTGYFPRQTTTSLAQEAWRRELHTSSRRKNTTGRERQKSDPKNEPNDQKSNLSSQSNDNKSHTDEYQPPQTTSQKYLHLPHLPKIPHRPTKEELLAAATGFWSRLKVRFKWFSIRSVRPWNIDDWSAFVSWFVLGNIVWILVGTTTFFSLIIFSINTVVAQGIF